MHFRRLILLSTLAFVMGALLSTQGGIIIFGPHTRRSPGEQRERGTSPAAGPVTTPGSGTPLSPAPASATPAAPGAAHYISTTISLIAFFTLALVILLSMASISPDNHITKR